MIKINFTQGFTNSLTAIAFVVGSLISVQSLPEKANAIDPPPDRGTPRDPSGGTITRPPLNCPKITEKPSALVMNNNHDFTLSGSPTIWIYVPYPPDSVSSIELAVLDKVERNTLHTRSVNPSQRPGFTAIQLSTEQEKFTLKVGQTYRWYIKIKCRSTQDMPQDTSGAEIRGWIQRQETTSGIERQLASSKRGQYRIYQQNQIWYDAIDSLAREYFRDPNNPELKQAWTNLLKKLRLK